MNAQDIFLNCLRALNESQFPYMVVGAFSSNYYGIQRSTQDADFLLQADDLPITKFRRLLGSDYQMDPQLSLETITFGTHYMVRHPETDFTIDLFLLRDDPYDRENFSRRRQISYGKGATYMPSPENVVISKLLWSKRGHRTKDIDDARNVLAVQEGRLDLDYIRKWCDEHGTRALLEETLKSIPPLPPQ